MKQSIFALILAFSLLITACSQKATETPATTSTPDPCSSENLPREAAKVNKLMREFDDYSALASNTLQSQLIVIIPDMQRILRDTDLRFAPDISAPESGALDVLASATAIGKSADEQWIQVAIPGQPGQVAWVYASLVQLSVPIAQLPVVNQ